MRRTQWRGCRWFSHAAFFFRCYYIWLSAEAFASDAFHCEQRLEIIALGAFRSKQGLHLGSSSQFTKILTANDNHKTSTNYHLTDFLCLLTFECSRRIFIASLPEPINIFSTRLWLPMTQTHTHTHMCAGSAETKLKEKRRKEKGREKGGGA